MNRRKFLGALAGVPALPLVARAQEPNRTYRLGMLVPASRTTPAVGEMFDELRLSGFVEGQNLTIVGDFGVAPAQIAEGVDRVVKAAPDAIVSGPELYARAFRAATRTIPLIAISEDMVAEGLVASLAKPGGNLTGISLLSPELDDKRQDILIEAVPGIKRLAALADVSITQKRHLDQQKQRAQSLGVELSVFTFSKPGDIPAALDEAVARGAQAINLLATPIQQISQSLIFERMAALRLPVIYQWADTADEGGLMAYGPRFPKVYRQRARQIVKILRGAKPADIPVEQPSSFELVINLRTARAIGHEVPAGLVLRADKVIE